MSGGCRCKGCCRYQGDVNVRVDFFGRECRCQGFRCQVDCRCPGDVDFKGGVDIKKGCRYLNKFKPK